MDIQSTLEPMKKLKPNEQKSEKPLANNELPEFCPPPDDCICGGTGWFRVDTPSIYHPWFGKMHPCRCKLGEITTGTQLAIGSEFYPISLSEFVVTDDITKEIRLQAGYFTRDRIPTFCVWGSNGAGKTTILSAITNEFIKFGVTVLYITALDAMTYIKAGINDTDLGTDARISRLVQVPVLCMDELTQVRWTEYNQETLETILDRRFRVARQTAVACDQNPDEFLSTRLASRLKQGAYIHLVGQDWRPEKGKRMVDRAAAMERGE